MNGKQNRLSFNFDLSVEVDAGDIRKSFQDQVKDRFQRMIQNKAEVLFLSHNQIQPYLKRNGPDSDAGVLRQQVDAMVTDFALSPRFQEYVARYCEEHFEEVLRKACDKAMEHKANKLAHAFAKKADLPDTPCK